MSETGSRILELTEITTVADDDELVVVDVSDTTYSAEGTNKRATKESFFSGWDGWISAGETWTYASATTFTISGDLTGKYQKGDKIKLTQTTAKYFYIVGVAYADPNTTVTVTAGDDYSLANAAITSPYYSKEENPQGFPGVFLYTAPLTPGGNMTYTDTTSKLFFSIKGQHVILNYAAGGTTGGTASTYIDVTLPVACLSASSYWTACMIRDGTYQGGLISVGTTYLRVYKEGLADWTLGVTRQFGVSLSYPL